MSHTSYSPMVTALLEIGAGVGLVTLGGAALPVVGTLALADGIRRGVGWMNTQEGEGQAPTQVKSKTSTAKVEQSKGEENGPEKNTRGVEEQNESVSKGSSPPTPSTPEKRLVSEDDQQKGKSPREAKGSDTTPVRVTIAWTRPEDVTYVPGGFKLSAKQLSATSEPPNVPLLYRTTTGTAKELKIGDALDAGEYDITAEVASPETHAAKPVTQNLKVKKAQARITWRLSQRKLTLQDRTYRLPTDQLNATFAPDPTVSHTYSKNAYEVITIRDDDPVQVEITVTVTDVNYEGSKSDTLTLSLSSAAQSKKPPSNEPQDTNVIGYGATDPALYELYEKIGGKAPSGQFYTVCAPGKAGGHYTYRGKEYEMFHNSSGSREKDNSRTAWTIIVNQETRVVGVGYHTGEVDYHACFPKAINNGEIDCGPSVEMTDADT